MKIVILGAEARYRAYQPAMPFIQQQELVFLDKDSTEAEILAAGADAEVLFVDAITVVSRCSDGTHALPAADSLGGGGV